MSNRSITVLTSVASRRKRGAVAMKLLTWLPIAAIVALVVPSPSVYADRGRPRLNGKTFVSDTGVPLRGPFTSTEWTPAVPAAQIANMLTYNFNAVHLYAETFDPNYPAGTGNKPGYAASRVDSIVASTKAANMYVVIVLANSANNGKFSLQYARDFWSFYAKRYAAETHVLFEIHNEPVQWGPPYSTSTQSPGAINMMADCYKIIRSEAPSTPVLLMTYASIGGGSSAAGAVQDLQAFKTLVFNNATHIFTNEAVAIHGYWGAQGASDAAAALIKAGYNVVLTEFASATSPTSPNGGQDTTLTKFMEQQGVSWLTFLHIPPTGVSGDVTDPAQYANPMKAAGISFAADTGLPVMTIQSTLLDSVVTTRPKPVKTTKTKKLKTITTRTNTISSGIPTLTSTAVLPNNLAAESAQDSTSATLTPVAGVQTPTTVQRTCDSIYAAYIAGGVGAVTVSDYQDWEAWVPKWNRCRSQLRYDLPILQVGDNYDRAGRVRLGGVEMHDL
ncbi:hypothetical protein HDU93_001861 [Gonapodya sp. JEL0774]|nr:hypothetical protein HDU93_001861 [Gonapodya sp. JEL0774]